MTAEESPDPDLKDSYLLTSDAPASDSISEYDPALGKVRLMVQEMLLSSEITVRPLGRVVINGNTFTRTRTNDYMNYNANIT